jgi:hypothetical protein
MMSTRLLAILCSAAVLAGCSAAGSSMPSEGNGTTPAHGREVTGAVTFRIKVPKVRRSGRTPRYVSPATKSIVLKITGPTKVSETANLTANSKGCTSSVTGTLCELSLTLKPGGYTATISTYDGLKGTGNVLSTAQSIAFKVTAGTGNTVGLTLSGIPHAIFVAPASDYGRTGAGGQIELFGTSANRLLIEAMDADGDAILGPGSPSFSIAKAFGGLAVTVSQPATTSPNIFTVTPPSSFSEATATLSIQAVYNSSVTDGCAQSGSNCFGSVTIGMAEVGAVAAGSGFAVFQVGDASPFASTGGLTQAYAAAFDSAANLYVATASGIVVYGPPYTAPSFVITSGVGDPRALAFDNAGTLYVANCPTCFGAGTDDVTEYAPPFSAASVAAATVVSGISEPISLAFDGSNDLFVANVTGNSGVGSVTEYTGGALAATITNAIAAPNALAFDTGVPALFVSNSAGGVEEYHTPFNGAAPSGSLPTTSPGGGVTAYCGTAGTPLIDHPVALAAAPASSRVFVASSSAGAVNAVVSFSDASLGCRGLFDAGGDPAALAVDGAPRLFVGNYTANTVTVYDSLASRPPLQQATLDASAPAGLAIAP